MCLSDFICETCWEDEFDDSGYFDYDDDYDEEEAGDFVPDKSFIMAYRRLDNL